MEDLDHPALIDERKQIFDDAAYEKNINQDVKKQSIKKKYILIIKLNTGQQL